MDSVMERSISRPPGKKKSRPLSMSSVPTSTQKPAIRSRPASLLARPRTSPANPNWPSPTTDIAALQAKIPQPDPARAPNNATNEDRLQPVRRRLKRVERLADKAVLAHYELEHEQNTLDNCHRFVEQSTQALVQITRTLLSNTPDDWQAVLEASQQRMQHDYIAFKTQSALLTDVRVKLSRLQDRLRAEASKLATDLDDLGNLLPAAAADSDLHLRSEGSSDSVASVTETDTPSLLARYYDRKGDVSIWYDRLVDLDSSYNDDVVSRENIKDRGDTPDKPDDQFETLYLQRRQEILDELDTAQKEADALAESCEAMGLIIPDAYSSSEAESEEPPPRHLPSPSRGAPLVPGAAMPSRGMPFRFPPRHGGNFGFPPLQSQSARKRNRIRGWLERTTSDPGTPLETEARPSNSSAELSQTSRLSDDKTGYKSETPEFRIESSPVDLMKYDGREPAAVERPARRRARSDPTRPNAPEVAAGDSPRLPQPLGTPGGVGEENIDRH